MCTVVCSSAKKVCPLICGSNECETAIHNHKCPAHDGSHNFIPCTSQHLLVGKGHVPVTGQVGDMYEVDLFV
jgi:hypothetical protein